MQRKDQEKRMKKAAIEGMKNDEQALILYLSQSLRNMKAAAYNIEFPINADGVYEMMKVLKGDLKKIYPRKNSACIQNTNTRENPIYQNLDINVGTYKVWISKNGTNIYICVDGLGQ